MHKRKKKICSRNNVKISINNIRHEYYILTGITEKKKLVITFLSDENDKKKIRYSYLKGSIFVGYIKDQIPLR